jgi:hypothetical protein
MLGQKRLSQSRADDWAAEISLPARIPDRMPKAEVLELAKSAFAIGYQRAEVAHRESRAEYFRSRIQVGHGDRQITAFVFDAPYPFIEIYSEPGSGALTASEALTLSRWLNERALEMQPQQPVHWLRRLMRRKPTLPGHEPHAPALRKLLTRASTSQEQ